MTNSWLPATRQGPWSGIESGCLPLNPVQSDRQESNAKTWSASSLNLKRGLSLGSAFLSPGMNQDRLKELIQAARHNQGFLDTLLQASSVDEAVSAAKQAGFDIEAQDLESFLAQPQSQLSESELEAIAGGMPNLEEPVEGRIPTFIACYTHQWMAGCGHTHNNKKGCKSS